jgi:hypothetical protein
MNGCGSALCRRVLWLIPILVLLHNTEEALTFPRYLPIVQERAPDFVKPYLAGITYPTMLWALTLATLVPLAVVVWAVARPSSRVALWFAVTLQAVVAINVVSHVLAAAFLLRGYSPGVATAVLVNAPFSVYFYRRAAREHWLPRRALLSTWPAAVFIHGPGLLGIFALARFLQPR